jgi:type IV pilus assembly protein PilA
MRSAETQDVRSLADESYAMLRTRRTPLGCDDGFTLIELLVVILIIGILAAIAIPSFLNQKGKASDASAKELAHTAQVAAETYATDNSGSYVGLTPAILNTYEATIQVGSGSGNAFIASPGGVSNVAVATYTVTATSTLGHTFSINRAANGLFSRTCAPASTGGCPASSNW